MCLTSIGLPFIVVYMNYPMFGTRFRVGFLFPVFITLYIALISYQYMLFHMGLVTRRLPGSRPCDADFRSETPMIKVPGTLPRRSMP